MFFRDPLCYAAKWAFFLVLHCEGIWEVSVSENDYCYFEQCLNCDIDVQECPDFIKKSRSAWAWAFKRYEAHDLFCCFRSERRSLFFVTPINDGFQFAVLSRVDHQAVDFVYIDMYLIDHCATVLASSLLDNRMKEKRSEMANWHCRGDVSRTIHDLLGGLRSACTYIGATKLKELSKRATFVRVTQQTNDQYSAYEVPRIDWVDSVRD